MSIEGPEGAGSAAGGEDQEQQKPFWVEARCDPHEDRLGFPGALDCTPDDEFGDSLEQLLLQYQTDRLQRSVSWA